MAFPRISALTVALTLAFTPIATTATLQLTSAPTVEARSGGSGGGFRRMSRSRSRSFGGGGGGFRSGRRGGGGFGVMFLSKEMIILIAVGMAVMYGISAIQQAKARRENERAEAISVGRVQLGFNAPRTEGLRDHIESIVRSSDPGTASGLWRMGQRVLEHVQAHLDDVDYAGFMETKALPPERGEREFYGLTRKARDFFDREIVRKDATGLTTTQRNSDKATDLLDEDGEFGIPEFFVVTLIMASQGRGMELPKAVGGHVDVAAAVEALMDVDRQHFVGFEVVWTPAAESDILGTDELLTEFPELAPL